MAERAGRRWRSSTVVAAVVLSVFATGCQANWVMPGFDAGNTRATTDDSINVVNVRSLSSEWAGVAADWLAEAPVVVSGIAYVSSNASSPVGRVTAFDTTASAVCAGAPGPCEPLWTGETEGWINSSPTVVGGKVYVGTRRIDMTDPPPDPPIPEDGMVVVFDAAGTEGCTGSPKVCEPRWTAHTSGPILGSPLVVGGTVFVGSSDGNLYAFDAAGVQGCGGSPRTCEPLWTAPTPGAIRSTPAVVGGVVYVGSSDGLYAFDAVGADGCAGSPTVCEPLWRAPMVGPVLQAPVVVGGTAFVVDEGTGTLFAVDAAGVAGCSGTPRICEPLWRASVGQFNSTWVSVAGGQVYAARSTGSLYALDAAGQRNCGGSPTTCTPLWVASGLGNVNGPPSVVGYVVLMTAGGRVKAFDAAGGLGCSGTTSITCTPVWQSPTGVQATTSPIVANGALYVGSTNELRVFRPQTSTVPVPPVVPQPVAVVGNGEITLRWLRPDRVDLPIAALVLRRFENGVAQPPTELDPATTQLTFTGLDPATAYSFQIAVRVGSVIGAPSPMSDVETPSADVAPATILIDPAHTGRALSDVSSNPALTWSKDFPGGTVSYPVYANGRVFVIVDGDASGANGGKLYALQAASGAVLWGPVSLNGTQSPSRLAYEDHKVYAITAAGLLRAFDEATGTERWSLQLSGGSGAPTAYRGLVYARGQAIDGERGSLVWQQSVWGGTPPAVDGSALYVDSQESACRLDALSAALIWKTAANCLATSSRPPVLYGGKLYSRGTILDTFGVTVRDADTGATTGTYVSRVPSTFSGDLRFDMATDRMFQAIDTSTGQVRWTQEGDGRLSSAPIVVGTDVIVGGRTGALFAYDTTTGAVTWTADVGAPILDFADSETAGGATAGGNRLYVAASGRLVAFS